MSRIMMRNIYGVNSLTEDHANRFYCSVSVYQMGYLLENLLICASLNGRLAQLV